MSGKTLGLKELDDPLHDVREFLGVPTDHSDIVDIDEMSHIVQQNVRVPVTYRSSRELRMGLRDEFLVDRLTEIQRPTETHRSNP